MRTPSRLFGGSTNCPRRNLPNPNPTHRRSPLVCWLLRRMQSARATYPGGWAVQPGVQLFIYCLRLSLYHSQKRIFSCARFCPCFLPPFFLVFLSSR
jgi:hypothetical protein